MIGTGKKAKAHHEAGHAVATRVLNVSLEYVTTMAAEDSRASALRASASYHARNADLLNRLAAAATDCKIALAGPYAQQHYARLRNLRFNQQRARDDEWRADLTDAMDCVATAVILEEEGAATPAGKQITLNEAQTAKAITLFDRLSNETGELIQQHWPAIERVAAALDERKILSESEVDTLISQK